MLRCKNHDIIIRLDWWTGQSSSLGCLVCLSSVVYAHVRRVQWRVKVSRCIVLCILCNKIHTKSYYSISALHKCSLCKRLAAFLEGPSFSGPVFSAPLSEVWFTLKMALLRYERPCGSWGQRTMMILDSWEGTLWTSLIDCFFAMCYGSSATGEHRFKIGDFAPVGTGWPKISGRRGRPLPTVILRKVG